jgi:hypothetical protein
MTVSCDTAGEVFFTIPATKMATDNQLQRIANLQVVWYTSAITTMFPTLDYLQRLQRGVVKSKLREEKVNDNDLANSLTRMSNCFLSTNPEGNSGDSATNLEGNSPVEC